MLEKPTTCESVPFFWTVLLGQSIRYTGKSIYRGRVYHPCFRIFKPHNHAPHPPPPFISSFQAMGKDTQKSSSKAKWKTGSSWRCTSSERRLPISAEDDRVGVFFALNVFPSRVNRDEVVVAAASLMFDPAVARLAELMATGRIITRAEAQ